ncbi:MAG: hypothetical protein KatS3mg103_1261 [Phycisphaerales bacterium]|nr:MAG: hypothetical protein KatS3mg103_1261 [Phycisphaerales bacterium]
MIWPSAGVRMLAGATVVFRRNSRAAVETRPTWLVASSSTMYSPSGMPVASQIASVPGLQRSVVVGASSVQPVPSAPPDRRMRTR